MAASPAVRASEQVKDDRRTQAAGTGLVEAPQSLGRAVANTIKGALGNLVEWYDVYVYTVFLKYFEGHFLSPEDKNATVVIWAVFAVTFLMRPVGSWFFGRYADRRGRRAALTLSVCIMASCSFIIGILPGREVIGGWAILALMACRLVQGFATGGEYGTSATYMSEAAVQGRRGFFSSFQCTTLVAGHVLAQSVLLIFSLTMSQEALQAWGWRVAFIIGGLLALVVLVLRRTMDESLSEEHLRATRSGEDTTSGTLRELLKNYWRPFVLVFFLTTGGTVCFYTFSVNAPSIVKNTFADTPVTATVLNLVGLSFLMLIQPVGGLISDRVGRKPLYLFFGFGALAYTWVLVLVLPTVHTPILSLLIVMVGYIILTGYTSINAVLKADQFPPHVRAIGLGTGYALANSMFGGTAPMMYNLSKQHADTVWFVVYVMVIVSTTVIATLFFLKEENGHLDRTA